uniref:Uncharacterized protein n=1 Tax=Nomascus leucogenys TaxID=61853 RepID=G1S0U4_NOMLE
MYLSICPGLSFHTLSHSHPSTLAGAHLCAHTTKTTLTPNAHCFNSQHFTVTLTCVHTCFLNSTATWMLTGSHLCTHTGLNKGSGRETCFLSKAGWECVCVGGTRVSVRVRVC